MAKIQLINSESLTVEELLEKLNFEFTQKGYEVYKTSLIGADIVIRKKAFIGVSIKLKKNKNGTLLRVNGMVPAVWARLLSGIWILFLIGKWNKLVGEVRDFVTSERFYNNEMELGQEEEFNTTQS